MPEFIRSRECVIYFKGDTQTVAISKAMATGGWPGGQGVQWDSSIGDTRIVTYSEGLYGGILIWGSDESGDDFTASTRQQPHYRYATMFSGGSLLATTTYERYTYASRVGPGPLVALDYRPNSILYLSKRGLFTIEDELSLTHDLRAPNFFCGFVSQLPKSVNSGYLGVQTSF